MRRGEGLGRERRGLERGKGGEETWIVLLHSDEFKKCIRKRAEFSSNEIQRYIYLMSYHMAYVLMKLRS